MSKIELMHQELIKEFPEKKELVNSLLLSLEKGEVTIQELIEQIKSIQLTKTK